MSIIFKLRTIKNEYVWPITTQVIESTLIPFIHSMTSGDLVRLHLNSFSPLVYTENAIKFGFLASVNYLFLIEIGFDSSCNSVCTYYFV